MTLSHAVLVPLLAERIYGTDAAIRAAALPLFIGKAVDAAQLRQAPRVLAMFTVAVKTL
ncbi:hypothetical protein [Pseudomonas fluorescens]|uniref:Uncharacterized protein n=1 Tax=Pseudomonas fluorescens TaxID=294 RepID=A0A944HFS6_PSEFL|nr:hypothetical protein [Pseudomonas fluorescens]MBT2298473.1 hypothetical protein [Pseudomonas fluorescens]MBT2309999.1 hypothetical protein [Pseudomonas fluorescens]MBT2311022.1 hypothetical protein [Pseudomonas fluorescens]MBT2320043.1 hypothetical protein [Pseudomonas fluorescens]MBT2328929.1 hypothetical protein [Pseudomonas fluorescens]